LINIIDFYETSETINIVMENFSNQSLASFVRDNRPLSEDTIRTITKNIATALVYLHQNKISHRDIKPENILINSQGDLKIIDLGLAMMGDFQEMTVAGTPQYMCP
jgi:serine/threonine protein kinase